MRKSSFEREMRIFCEEGTRLMYRFNNLELINDVEDYAREHGITKETVYEEIGKALHYGNETVRHQVTQVGKIPQKGGVKIIKEYGKILKNNEFSYLIPYSDERNESAAIEESTKDAPVITEFTKVNASTAEGELYSSRIKEIFRMLYDVLSLVDASGYYNYIPSTKDSDGSWDYFDRMIINTRNKASTLFLGERNTAVYKKLTRIIDETDIYIKSFSMPGVVQRWRDINPTINYFDCVFDAIAESSYETVQEWRRSKFVRFMFFPTREDIVLRRKYFAEKDAENFGSNLHYSYERYFQDELLATLEKVFEHDFWGKE